MVFFTTTLLAAMLAMAPLTAHAHMTMSNPSPWGSPNNSPLIADGSDFPCKSVPYTANKANAWPVGSTQQLTLGGTAVHGGGSCQISVSTDKAPTKASKWKVIYSIEGGCPPPPPEGGNYPEQSNAGIPPFNFTIPSELPNGDLAMAWTWFNKVGNREMYMNCAPVTITGGASDTSSFNALPDMAVANIASQGTCQTAETFDYTFENPGKYKIQNGKGPFKPLCGGLPGGAGGAPAAPQQPANPGVPSQAPANPSAPPHVSSAPNSSPPAVSAPAGGALTSTLRTVVTVTAPLGSTPTMPKDPVSPSSPAPAASSQASVAPSQAPAAPAPAPGGSICSPDGSVVCSGDGTQFALCNFGKAVFQPVAKGTTCQGGKIAKRHDYATTMKIVYV
jgi:hypothetical protein